MTEPQSNDDRGCIFCAIASGHATASRVFEDDTVVAFMDLNPVTPGHLLVVPRIHVVGFEDLPADTGARVWSVGHQLARVSRRSNPLCEGINMFVCDGEVAFQTVFHFHLHVIPRYRDDGWSIVPKVKQRDRSLLDADARALKEAVALGD